MSSTLSSSPTYAKSSRTLKVNSILYPSPLPSPLDGILLHTPSLDHDRFTSTSTGTREEARGLKADKEEEEEKELVASDQFGGRTGAAGPTAEPSGAPAPIPDQTEPLHSASIRWPPNRSAYTSAHRPTRRTNRRPARRHRTYRRTASLHVNLI